MKRAMKMQIIKIFQLSNHYKERLLTQHREEPLQTRGPSEKTVSQFLNRNLRGQKPNSLWLTYLK